MNSIGRILAVAAFEARLARRMIRVWIFSIIALLVGLGLLANRLFVLLRFGGWSGSATYITKDLVVQNSTLFLAIALSIFGIFYVFDWRHRETDVRFADTFDTSPLTRLEHAWGKFLGTCAGFVFPFLLLLPVQVFAHLFWDLQIPVKVYVVSYLVWAPVFLLVPVAVAFGVAGLTGSRALAILLSVGWLGVVASLLGWLGGWAKVPELPGMMLAGIGSRVIVWSDFLGYHFGLPQVLMFVASLALASGFVCLGAAGKLAPARSLVDTRRRWLVTVSAFLVWGACNAFVAGDYLSETQRRRDIVAAERSAAAMPAAAVVHRDLSVTLDPDRRRLSGRAALELRNETEDALERLSFRLNAGLAVTSLEGAGSHERDHTVIAVELERPLPPGDTTLLVFEYEGGIDDASIDATEELYTRGLRAPGKRIVRRFLGRAPAYLEPAIVALGTDAGWYPEPAMQFGLAYPEQPRPSLATSRLRVELPDGWLAASAGRRSEDGSSLIFESDLELPALSLNAGPFNEEAMEVEGTTFRLLYSERHQRNIDFFREAMPLIRRTLADRLRSIEVDAGLSFELPELTLVEVPQPIGGYSAGWSAPNRLAAPGVVMVREGQLFGARFEALLDTARARFDGDSGGIRVSVSVEGEEVASTDDTPVADQRPSADETEEEPEEGGEEASGDAGREAEDATGDEELTEFDQAQAKYDLLARFLSSDVTGGDIERSALKSAWDFRIRATGDASPVAGSALSAYLAELALGRPSIETPEVARLLENQGALFPLSQAIRRGQSERVAEIVIGGVADMDEVYETMLAQPLIELDPTSEAGLFAGVLFLKGRQPLKALRDTLGRERFNNAVGTLLEGHAGGEFEWPDFREAFLAQVEEKDRAAMLVLFDNWLAGTELPGFVVTDPKAVRIEGEEERWQVTATIANRGTAPGTAKFLTGRDDDQRTQLVSLDPGEEVEVGLVSPTKPRGWRLAPYLALNRTQPVGSFDLREDAEELEPFEGSRPAEVLGQLAPVVVDNLDPGFTVTLADGREVTWDAKKGEDEDELRQLNAFGIFRSPKEWSRWRSQQDWYRPYGLFDVTAAIKRVTEDADQPAHWRASLPEPGLYRVEAYMPPSDRRLKRRIVPEWTFVVHGSDGQDEVKIETEAAQDGWNDLGRFRFGLDGEVELSDGGEKGIVIADAVRFVKEAS